MAQNLPQHSQQTCIRSFIVISPDARVTVWRTADEQYSEYIILRLYHSMLVQLWCEEIFMQTSEWTMY